MIIALKNVAGCMIENALLDPPCAPPVNVYWLPLTVTTPGLETPTDVDPPVAGVILLAFLCTVVSTLEATPLIEPVGVYGGKLFVIRVCVSLPSETPSAREVSPDPAPATPKARPNVLGSVMRQLAAHAAAAVP